MISRSKRLYEYPLLLYFYFSRLSSPPIPIFSYAPSILRLSFLHSSALHPFASPKSSYTCRGGGELSNANLSIKSRHLYISPWLLMSSLSSILFSVFIASVLTSGYNAEGKYPNHHWIRNTAIQSSNYCVIMYYLSTHGVIYGSCKCHEHRRPKPYL